MVEKERGFKRKLGAGTMQLGYREKGQDFMVGIIKLYQRSFLLVLVIPGTLGFI